MQKVCLAILVVTMTGTCAQNDTSGIDCQDDGIFCNEIERLVDGECIKMPA